VEYGGVEKGGRPPTGQSSSQPTKLEQITSSERRALPKQLDLAWALARKLQRGFTESTSLTTFLLPYSPPTISSVTSDSHIRIFGL